MSYTASATKDELLALVK
ncbi:hypothetical protein N4599_02585 [Limosilactobacillus oris]|nr:MULTISPECIES: hypothetical protein [Limosilactobacillus]UXC68346.1 hypothetical protein N4599_02585 [Limosilactobacillus oris]